MSYHFEGSGVARGEPEEPAAEPEAAAPPGG
jgi:hypothetical protein